MDVHLVVDGVLFISIFISGLLIKIYLPGYIGEKAKNLATKEDIADITSRIEQVKVDYAKQLELYKSDIWQTQQRYLQMQEEAKLKVEVFKRAVVDVAKITDLIGIYQVHISNSEMNAAIAEVAFEKGNQEVQTTSWDMHLEYRGKAAALYSTFRELIVELGGTFVLFSIYFEPTLSESLSKIIVMAHGAVELKMPAAEFRKRLEVEYSKGIDLNMAKDNVGRYYDTLYSVKPMTVESNRFFKLMKKHIEQAGSKSAQGGAA